jgi:hypothetical protein
MHPIGRCGQRIRHACDGPSPLLRSEHDLAAVGCEEHSDRGDVAFGIAESPQRDGVHLLLPAPAQHQAKDGAKALPPFLAARFRLSPNAENALLVCFISIAFDVIIVQLRHSEI